jgi:uncharacterized protein with PhoU and TrkA domain
MFVNGNVFGFSLSSGGHVERFIDALQYQLCTTAAQSHAKICPPKDLLSFLQVAADAPHIDAAALEVSNVPVDLRKHASILFFPRQARATLANSSAECVTC